MGGINQSPSGFLERQSILHHRNFEVSSPSASAMEL